MILDAKEQWYTLENLEKVEHMQFLPIDAYAIENGKRCLEIPEGDKKASVKMQPQFIISVQLYRISAISSIIRNCRELSGRRNFVSAA